MKAPILRIFIVFILAGFSAGIKAQVDTQDSLALLDIKNKSSWNIWVDHSIPVWQWTGVTVAGNRVTKLQLPGQTLHGHIPAEIANLTALAVLNLTNNGIGDTIPTSIGNITTLTDIDLSKNSLTGKIPASIGNLPTLHTLYLNENRLSDSIPATIFNLAYNTQLAFQNNNLTFAGMEGISTHFLFPKYAPQNLVNLTVNEDGSLYTVQAGGDPNNNTYKWYKNDTFYTTKHGDYTLAVPASDSDNYYVIVTDNAVPTLTLQSIEMPWYLDSTSVGYYALHNGEATVYRKRVVSLSIHITGPNNITFPVKICNLSALKSLSITGTFDNPNTYGLIGNIPDEIANLKKLSYLNLNTNNLTSLPAAIGKLTNLTYLDVSNNYLSSIQPAIGRLTNLQTLSLNFNRTPGAIPDSLKYLSSLTELNLDGNNFTTGLLPLCSLTNLKKLRFSNNYYFTDTIPAGFANLTKLEELHMEDNISQSGSIAPIAGLVSLQSLNFIDTRFTGPIPWNIGNLTHLTTAYFNFCNLSDTLPASIGQLTSLQEISFESNNLSGKIPATIANMVSLQNIDFLRNHLTGSNIQFSPCSPRIQYNNFTFEGLEQLRAKFPGLLYEHQANIPIYREGNTLYVRAGGKMANDTFWLYRNNVLIDAHVKDSSFVITDAGIYYIKATNKVLKRLALYSDTIHIATLPVTLLNFTASFAKTDVQLNWQAAREINTANYIVERSLNGTTFTTIGKVQAAGNSAVTKPYSYLDMNAAALNTTKLYYRLKITDKDGSSSYSKIISLANDGIDKPYILYPNPVRTYATVQFTAAGAGNYSIKVTAANGKAVKLVNIAASAGSNRAVINMASLPAGSYLLTITGEKESKTITLVKE